MCNKKRKRNQGKLNRFEIRKDIFKRKPKQKVREKMNNIAAANLKCSYNHTDYSYMYTDENNKGYCKDRYNLFEVKCEECARMFGDKKAKV